MSVYQITHSETLALSIVLHLPIQPGSVLSVWLGTQELPESAELTEASLSSLAAKGYYSPKDPNQPFQPSLIKSLTLLSVNAAEMTVILRRNGRAALTRFAQRGKHLVQYSTQAEHLFMHPVTEQAVLAEKILPQWFMVSQNEGLRTEMLLGAFVLFKQACALADLTAAELNFEGTHFAKSTLLEQVQPMVRAMVAFSRAGLGEGWSVSEQRQLEDDYRRLIGAGFLIERADLAGAVEIGAGGKALAAALSDADLCSLIVSLQLWDGSCPKTGVFLYGARRLFLLEASPKADVLVIRQLANRQEGTAWVQDGLTEGSRARHADGVIAL